MQFKKHRTSLAMFAIVLLSLANLRHGIDQFPNLFVVMLTGVFGAMAFRVSGGFKTFSGLSSFALFVQLFAFPQLYLLTSSKELASSIDVDEVVLLIYFFAMLLHLVAVSVSMKFQKTWIHSQSYHFLHSSNLSVSNDVSLQYVVAAMAASVLFRWILGDRLSSLSEAIGIAIAVLAYSSARRRKNHAFVAHLWAIYLVLGKWQADGLSGMKTALLSPLAAIFFVWTISKFRPSFVALIIASLTAAATALVAPAIQGLRNVQEKDTSVRLAIACSMIEAEIHSLTGIDVEVPGSIPMIVNQLKLQADSQKESIKILERSSVLQSDVNILNTFARKGDIDYDYFYEMFRFVPKSVTNEEVGDYTNAYFGRYVGAWSTDDFTSGYTVSGPVVWYVYWGWIGILMNYLLVGILVLTVGNALFSNSPMVMAIIFSQSIFALTEHAGMMQFKFLYRDFWFWGFQVASVLIGLSFVKRVVDRASNQGNVQTANGRVMSARNFNAAANL